MNFIFDPSLVLYLPLYELDGASLQSKDAYRHLCTATGAVWRPSGRYFDGSDDFISCGDTDAVNVLGDKTIEAWVYQAAADVGCIISKMMISGSNVFQMGCHASDYPFFEAKIQGIATTYRATEFPLVGNWHHLVGIIHYDEKTIEFYGDAEPIGSSAGQCFGWAGGTLTIGKADHPSGYFLKATIGEVRIYNRALTPQEIHHNYLATKWRYR